MSDKLSEILNLLRRLETAGIHFELARPRDCAVMILVTVPGERWEIEYLEDGTIEIEIFRSDGDIMGPEALNDLFSRFADRDDHAEGIS
ncbi:MAG: hypothetical protein ABFE01_09680 [Phycisphaerales bacterium]